MPRFLLFTILVLVIAGHIFAVKEETSTFEDTETIRIEDLYFNEEYINLKEPIQVIEISSGDEETSLILIKEEEDCIFFDEGIPRLEACPVEIEDVYKF